MRCSPLTAALLMAAACGGDDGVTPPQPDAAPPPPGAAAIVINEIMADGRFTSIDGTATPGLTDWVELHNPTASDVVLDGWALTDDLAVPAQQPLAAGLVLPAGGHVVVSAALPRDGGVVGLSRPDGSWSDRVAWGAQASDLSVARLPDGSDRWEIVWNVSPGASNGAGSGSPIGVEDAATPPEQAPAAGDVSEQLVGDKAFPSFELGITAADLTALSIDPFEYVPATITYDGRTIGPVGVRLKGQNSFRPIDGKPSFKVSIDEYVTGAELFGLDDLTLNNMVLDQSMMHERLAYLVARTAGLPASRATHALVSVNGVAYGLYTNLEAVDRSLLARWFSDAEGPLFEGWNVDFTAAYVPQYEHESGPDDRSALWALASALTLPTPGEQIAAAAAHVDLDEFRTFWGVCAVVGQYDSFPYSTPGDDYHVYVDPTTNRISFLPWGMDETFVFADLSVLGVTSQLGLACKGDPACRQAFADATWRILAATEELDLLAEVDRLAALLAPHVAADPRKEFTTAQVAEAQSSVRQFVAGRRPLLGSQLPPPTP